MCINVPLIGSSFFPVVYLQSFEAEQIHIKTCVISNCQEMPNYCFLKNLSFLYIGYTKYTNRNHF